MSKDKDAAESSKNKSQVHMVGAKSGNKSEKSKSLKVNTKGFKKNSKSDKTCFHCGKKGHFIKECRYKKKEDKRSGSSSKTNKANLVNDEDHVAVVTEVNAIVATNSDFFIDSGATIDICNNKFANGLDRDRVFVSQPWLFHKALLVLREYDGNQPPEEFLFDSCPFWIKVFGVPFKLMNEKVGIAIEESLGNVLDIDPITERYLRIRVDVDLRCPFKNGMTLSAQTGDVEVDFFFEKRPDYYWHASTVEADGVCAVVFEKSAEVVSRLVTCPVERRLGEEVVSRPGVEVVGDIQGV
ncbi:Zinc finger, CCHC-type [Corchorus olitorius]|uniref:Zinc finger, CCHC-type n=1 Tax=Corchorus olitorius TaxID=93759 RepID=A0A1R3G1I6_9ROSI|nr:Zinc finger, CCHC-type [Corchorus olitorius]